ncbi:unnamed protein product [Calicophoron daubneyi]|uniref:HTH psq-type domain-containing protein n=1 Tax=Calicophoron daubneyi TaxID=300641 RepID=A0AAV2TNF4_CALDB
MVQQPNGRDNNPTEVSPKKSSFNALLEDVAAHSLDLSWELSNRRSQWDLFTTPKNIRNTSVDSNESRIPVAVGHKIPGPQFPSWDMTMRSAANLTELVAKDAPNAGCLHSTAQSQGLNECARTFGLQFSSYSPAHSESKFTSSDEPLDLSLRTSAQRMECTTSPVYPRTNYIPSFDQLCNRSPMLPRPITTPLDEAGIQCRLLSHNYTCAKSGHHPDHVLRTVSPSVSENRPLFATPIAIRNNCRTEKDLFPETVSHLCNAFPNPTENSTNFTSPPPHQFGTIFLHQTAKSDQVPMKTKNTVTDVCGKAVRRPYTEVELAAAVRSICFGRLGTRRAASVYGIPRSTLRNKICKLNELKRREEERLGGRSIGMSDFLGTLLPDKNQEISTSRLTTDQGLDELMPQNFNNQFSLRSKYKQLEMQDRIPSERTHLLTGQFTGMTKRLASIFQVNCRKSYATRKTADVTTTAQKFRTPTFRGRRAVKPYLHGTMSNGRYLSVDNVKFDHDRTSSSTMVTRFGSGAHSQDVMDVSKTQFVNPLIPSFGSHASAFHPLTHQNGKLENAE